MKLNKYNIEASYIYLINFIVLICLGKNERLETMRYTNTFVEIFDVIAIAILLHTIHY